MLKNKAWSIRTIKSCSSFGEKRYYNNWYLRYPSKLIIMNDTKCKKKKSSSGFSTSCLLKYPQLWKETQQSCSFKQIQDFSGTTYVYFAPFSPFGFPQNLKLRFGTIVWPMDVYVLEIVHNNHYSILEHLWCVVGISTSFNKSVFGLNLYAFYNCLNSRTQ